MKRIIVACDGTGQSTTHGGGNAIPTNVARFCNSLSNSSPTQQLVFYQSGVGTQDLGFGWGLDKNIQGALGAGVEDNVADGYAFLMNNYQVGDQLFFFGFSRGAFTARALANLVVRLGIISKEYCREFGKTIKAYKNGTLEGRINEMKNVDEDWVHKVEIEVVGCWDTVASMGVPWTPFTNPGGVTKEYKYLDVRLVKGIKHAFHALALDECRGPFTPTLWYLPEVEDDEDLPILEQCWFPGVHTNIGGGYPDRALANLPLAWMIDQCHLLLDFDLNYLKRFAELHHHPEELYKDEPDNTEIKDIKKFDATYQGYGCGKLTDSYWEGKTWTWKYRTPGKYPDEKTFKTMQTNETMHSSVQKRRAKLNNWDPEALKGFERKKDDKGVWKWVKTGSKDIPEAHFRSSTDCFEKLLQDGPKPVKIGGHHYNYYQERSQ